jgi:hypothetical protein
LHPVLRWRIRAIRDQKGRGEMSLDLERYRLACSKYDEEWKATDEVLYALCQRYPDHQDRGGINAKLWIIGRAYATGIERKITSKGTQGSSMEQLSVHLLMKGKDIDAILEGVRGVREPLTPDKLTKILDAHGRLVSIVQGALRNGQTPRSFVSKYLHFHNPVVPIFDSVAIRAARKHYRRERDGAAFEIPATADEQYADFLLRFWLLYQEARAAGVRVSVKLLDNYLLALAREAK